jgi:hypothetical protein
MDPSPSNLMFSLRRLYATLRILLPESDAGAVARGLSRDSLSDDETKGMFRSAELRLLRQYILRLVRRAFGRGGEEPDPVERLRRLTPYPSILLTLHLGLGLDANQLAYLFNGHPEPVARELLHARLKILEIPEHQCKVFPELLGRYRDASHDIQIRATLSSHIVRCARCRILIGKFERMDAEIMGEIDAIEAAAPRTGPQPQVSGTLLNAAPVAVLLVLVGVAVLVITGLATGLLGGPARSISLAMDAEVASHQGTLLLGTWDGELQTLDLATGTRRTLRDSPFSGSILQGARYLLAPDRDTIAIFAQTQATGLHWATREIDIVDVHGNQVNHLQLQSPEDIGWPTAWLNEREILLLVIPAYQTGDSTERYLERLEEGGRVRAIDIETGQSRTLHHGAVSRVFPSPDGERVLLVKPYDPREPGITVTLHRVEESGLSEPLLEIPSQYIWDGGIAWSPDSQHFHIGLITSYVESERDRTTPGMNDDFRGRITSIDLHRVERDGDLRQITEVDEGHFARILSVSPDGNRILFDTAVIQNGEDYHVWNADPAGEDRVSLDLLASADDDGLWQLRPEGETTGMTWSPDSSEFVLFVSRTYYLPSDEALNQGAFRAAYVTVFDQDLQPSIVSVLSQNWRVTPLRWLDTGELPTEPESASSRSGQTGRPEAVEIGRGDVRLGPDSTISPDGRALTMTERVSSMNRPFLLFPEAGTGRWIAPRTNDLAWFDDGHALLAVTSVQQVDGDQSRITQHNADRLGGSSVEAFLDPAGLRDAANQEYALPMPTSDGTRASFYVVYTDRTPVDLWVGSSNGSVERVYTYQASPRGRRVAPLTGQWIGSDTFLFTEPVEWRDGLPVRSALMQLRILETGEFDIDLLFDVEARGRDFGVSIIEFDVNATGTNLAYRVRHFTNRHDHGEVYDTIHIASASDLRQALEVQRGERGEGLTWSPDGEVLAMEIDERLGVYHMSTHTFDFISQRTHRARYPVWIADDELWFSRGSGRNAEVYRVWVN